MVRFFTYNRTSKRKSGSRVKLAVPAELLEERVLPATLSTVAILDNVLVEHPEGSLANGSGTALLVGNTGQQQNNIRRSVVQFDVSSIPAGSTIQTVQLTLQMTRSQDVSTEVFVHRVTQQWGEGASASGGGQGDIAQTGDATWLHTFHSDQFWNSPGGDFVGQQSASLLVAGADAYTWSDPGLVSDVQAWIDNSEENAGWVLFAAPNAGVSKLFESRESTTAEFRPRLEIEFVPPPADIEGRIFHDVNADMTPAASETWVNDFEIELLDADGNVIATTISADRDLDENGEISLATETGWYRFADLAEGDYRVRTTPIYGWSVPDEVSVGVAGVTATAAPLPRRLLDPQVFDVDSDGQSNAETDGLLWTRFLAAFSPEAVATAASNLGTRTDALDLSDFQNAAVRLLDVDQDGNVSPLSDGVLIRRYLDGLTGDSLVNNAVNPAGARTNAADIQSYLDALVPPAAGPLPSPVPKVLQEPRADMSRQVITVANDESPTAVIEPNDLVRSVPRSDDVLPGSESMSDFDSPGTLDLALQGLADSAWSPLD